LAAGLIKGTGITVTRQFGVVWERITKNYSDVQGSIMVLRTIYIPTRTIRNI